MVGTILRNIRKIKKLKQKQVANYLSVAENTVSNYETEYSNITFELAIKFIHECNFDIQLINKEDGRVYSVNELGVVDKKLDK